MIILKRNSIEAELASRLSAKGEYRLVKTRADGSISQDTGWFDNVILTSGLNRWGTAVPITGCAIGTSTIAPSAAQTGLQSAPIWTTTQGASSYNTAQATAPYYFTRTFIYRFAAGTLSGNYSEVGVGWASTTLFSRALITDAVGAPQSIPVTSSEALDVYYRIRIYPPVTDVISTVNISGVNYTVTARAHSVTSTSYWADVSSNIMLSITGALPNAYSGALGSLISGGPSGSASAALSQPTMYAYSDNSMSRSMSTTFGLDEGNFAGGIQCFRTENYGSRMQFSFVAENSIATFGTNIPKDGNKTLVLNTGISWAARP